MSKQPQQQYNQSTFINQSIIPKIIINISGKRRDFLDPDFDFKTSVNLERNKKSRCRIKTQGESEIPELGLDAARLKLDCHLNPDEIAGAAMRVAKTYNKYRRERRRRPAHQKSGSTIKRKRTKIQIDREYERSKNNNYPHISSSSSASKKELTRQKVKVREEDNADDDDD